MINSGKVTNLVPVKGSDVLTESYGSKLLHLQVVINVTCKLQLQKSEISSTTKNWTVPLP